ncbi:MAG: ATP-binding protein, partial [Planctomycetota bacterium]
AGGDPDHRSDLFALGVLLYESASGRHPFADDEMQRTMSRILEEEPRRISEINPQLSPLFEELVHSLLAKDPAERWTDTALLADVLEEGESHPWWVEHATHLGPLRRPRIPRDTALYGREQELEQLDALFRQAHAGDGQVLIIEGEAGIGKTRLIDEFIQRQRQAGIDLNFLFGSDPPGSVVGGEGGIARAFQEHLGPSGSAQHLPPNLVPAFDAFLEGDFVRSGEESLSAEVLATCFSRTLQSLAEERTTVVFMDDLHFASIEARALFVALARAARNHRVLLVGTIRPTELTDWLAAVVRLEHARKIALSRLGPKSLALLLEESLGSSRLAESLAYRISVKSDGNPFFAFEIIRSLREGRFLTQTEQGSWITSRIIEEIDIPSSVRELIAARFSELEREERELLDIASCWGFEFDPSLVADALERDTIAVLQSLAHVERVHQLVRSAGRNLRFDHHQLQEALYDELPPRLREEYHALLAIALEKRTREAEPARSLELAEHFLRGRRGAQAKKYFKPALDHLVGAHRNVAAADLCEAMLAEPGLVVEVERAELLLRLELRLRMVGRPDRQREICEEALQLASDAGNAPVTASASSALGWIQYRVGEYSDAEPSLTEALRLARLAGDQGIECRVEGNLGAVTLQLGRLEEAVDHFRRGIALAQEIGNRRSELAVTGNLGSVFFARGQIAEAIDHFERAQEIAREIGSVQSEARGAGNIGVALYALGRIDEAQEYLERGLRLSREAGNRQGEANVLVNLGSAYSAKGRFEEARECFELSLCLAREVGNRNVEANAVGNLGGSYSSQGELAKAWELFEQRLAIFREIDGREGQILSVGNLAVLARRLGDPDHARALLDEGLAMAREHTLRRWEGWTLTQLGVLAAQAGANDEALRRYDEALAVEEEMGAKREMLATLAEIADAQPAELARETLARVLAIAAEIGNPVAECLARCRLALLGDEAPESLFEELRDRMKIEERMVAAHLLASATREERYASEAKSLLDRLVEGAPPERRISMIENVPLHRRIAGAK